jgi:hypothetical protein
LHAPQLQALQLQALQLQELQLQALQLSWWRRRFRLRVRKISQLIRDLAKRPPRHHRNFLALFALTAALAAAQEGTVTIDGGNTIQLCADCATRNIRASVTAAKFSVRKDQPPQVVEVNSNGVRDQAWKDWFQARWEPAEGVPSALVLSVSDRLRKAGTYNVVLSIGHNLPKLTVQVVQPAAQLDAPDKVSIERTQIWPGECCEPRSWSFDVRESSGLTDVTDLQVFNREAMQGTTGVSGTLTLEGHSTIQAGRAQTLHLDLTGDFPRGTTTGSFKLIAPQLAQPVTINYEVRTTLHELYLLFAILLGLGLSYIARYRLQERILRAQARLQADEILQEVADRLGNYDDAVAAAVADERDLLRNAALAGDPDRINQHAGLLRTQWQTALTDFATRNGQATGQLRDLQSVLSLPWQAPHPIQASIQTAKTAADSVTQLLHNHKADDALKAVVAASQQFGADLRDDGLAWQNAARGVLDLIANATLGIPEPVRLQFKDVLQNAPPELDRIKNENPPADAAGFKSMLNDVSTEYRAIAETMTRLKDRMQLEWSAAENLWRTAKLPRQDLLTELRRQFVQMNDALGAAADDPGPLRAGLPQMLADMQASWREDLVAQVPPGYAKLAQIQAGIEAREFVQAVQAVLAAQGSGDRLFGSAEKAVPANWPAGRPPQPGSHFITLFGTPMEQPAPIPGLPRVLIQRELNSGRLLQTAVVGALMALWAFTSYQQTFDGTYTGLLAPLVGAFLLDISIEGLKNQVKDKKD